jgi:hypothetical protein
MGWTLSHINIIRIARFHSLARGLGVRYVSVEIDADSTVYHPG